MTFCGLQTQESEFHPLISSHWEVGWKEGLDGQVFKFHFEVAWDHMASHYNLYISLEGRGHNTHIKPKFDFFSVWLSKTIPINKFCSNWMKIGMMFFLWDLDSCNGFLSFFILVTDDNIIANDALDNAPQKICASFSKRHLNIAVVLIFLSTKLLFGSRLFCAYWEFNHLFLLIWSEGRLAAHGKRYQSFFLCLITVEPWGVCGHHKKHETVYQRHCLMWFVQRSAIFKID